MLITFRLQSSIQALEQEHPPFMLNYQVACSCLVVAGGLGRAGDEDCEPVLAYHVGDRIVLVVLVFVAGLSLFLFLALFGIDEWRFAVA